MVLHRSTTLLLLSLATLSTQSLPYYEDATGRVVEIKSAATGFAFPYTQPQMPNYYANGKVHGSISRKLNHLGLNCSQNTPTKVGNYAGDLVNKYQPGTFQWLTNKVPLMGAMPSTTFPPGMPGFPASTNTVDGGVGGALHDKMMMMHNVSKLSGIFYVSHTTSSGTYSSSSLGSILETFKQAGNFIGSLQSGEAVQASQVGNLISGMLLSLSETTKKDWHYETENIMVATLPNAGGADMFAGVHYKYSAKVQDFKNKKVESHLASYNVENWSVVFSDSGTFNYVFKKFAGGN